MCCGCLVLTMLVLLLQIKVEEMLAKEEGKSRYDLGRENL